jgi:hypothetical protein
MINKITVKKPTRVSLAFSLVLLLFFFLSTSNAAELPGGHISTTVICEACHETIHGGTLIKVDHSHVLGTCDSCHNNVQYFGKSTTHINTTSVCESCHGTSSWISITVDHNEVFGACESCHLKLAQSVPSHQLTYVSKNCGYCHSTTRWSSVLVSSGYHTAYADNCLTCHSQTPPSEPPIRFIPINVGDIFFVIPIENGTLPPDPGEDNNSTIAGIDSDSDGVRDDLQRYVAIKYPSSYETRVSLEKLIKAQTNMMINANNSNAVRSQMGQLDKATECLFYIRPNDAHLVAKDIWSKILNTPQRLSAYLTADQYASGSVLSIPLKEDWYSSCLN